MWIPRWVLITLGIIVACFALVEACVGRAWGHPIDGAKNAAGEWCCGEGDCFVVPSQAISITARGYAISAATAAAGDEQPTSLIETIPYSEAQPSPDGQFWRCKRPDGTRRCFFAPLPGS